MATHALSSPHILDDDATPTAATPAPPLKPALMRRCYDALLDAQHRRAQREVDRVLGRGAYRRAMSAALPPEC